MAICDYTFYKDGYLKGKSPIIPSNEFGYYIGLAESHINRITTGHYKDYDEDDSVRLCACALAETYYTHETSKISQGIVSEKVGEYSATYSSSGKTEADKEYRVGKIVRDYLGITGLLYKGVR